jgi:tetratricopeptide (TPR) repeat protein
VRGRSLHRPAASRPTGRGLALALALAALAGCGTSKEAVQKADGHFREGIVHLTGNPQQAFVSLQKAVQLNPEHRDAHYYLGHLYAQQGKLPQAEAEFRAALAVDPTYSEAYTYLGQVLMYQNRWSEAIEAYRQALANPLYVTPDLAWFHLGVALAHEGDFEGAMRAFEDAALIAPPNVPPARLQFELGRTYYRLGYGDKAKEALTRVTGLDKDGEYGRQATQLLERIKP